MIFKKKKFNICVFVTILLIVVMILSSVFLIPADKDTIINVEGETEQEKDDFFYEEEVEEDKENEKEETVEAVNKPQNLTVVFANAWAAFNYAMKMYEKYPCYITYSQKIDGGAANLPVTVDASISRKIYNDVSEIYVINKPNTVVDIADLGIDKNVGVSYESHTYINLKQDFAQMVSGKAMDMETYRNVNVLLTYEIPYLINKSTVTLIGGLVNNANADYYEIQMELKPAAYQTYIKAMKKSIGLDDLPNIISSRLTIRIDKKTGTFKSISSVEKIEASYTYEGITAKVVATTKLTMKFDYSYKVEKKINEIKEKINYN